MKNIIVIELHIKNTCLLHKAIYQIYIICQTFAIFMKLLYAIIESER